MKKTKNATSGAANFSPVEPLSMGAQLHQHLRDAIIHGELLPGQAISEIEMSKRFSISRQPVREAFIKLGEEHLIEVRPQRGTYVRKISVKEMLDARHLREVIEISIVQEVAKKHDAGFIKEVRGIISRQKKVAADNNTEFLELDDELHRALAFQAGRQYAWRVTEAIKAQLDRARYLTFEFAVRRKNVIADHTAIVDAIEAGDPELATKRISQHLTRIITDLPVIAKQHPDYFIDE